MVDQWTKEAGEKGYGKTAELSFYSHTGVEDGPRALHRTSDGLEAHSRHGQNQLKVSAWAAINFNWAEEGSLAAFYGCDSLNFAKKFAGIQPVEFVAGYEKGVKAFPSQQKDARDVPLLGFTRGQNVYWVGGTGGNGWAYVTSVEATPITKLRRTPAGLVPVAGDVKSIGQRSPQRTTPESLRDRPGLY